MEKLSTMFLQKVNTYKRESKTEDHADGDQQELPTYHGL